MESSQPRSFYPGYSGLRAFEARTTLDELLSICLRNCASAFMALALNSGNIPQASIIHSETRPSIDRYVLNVLDLDSHILESWKNEKVNDGEEKLVKLLGGDVFKLLLAAKELHHVIIELLNEKGLLSPSKIPRTLVE